MSSQETTSGVPYEETVAFPKSVDGQRVPNTAKGIAIVVDEAVPGASKDFKMKLFMVLAKMVREAVEKNAAAM